MSPVDTVASEVRELVRRQGLDPLTDRAAAAVRRLIEAVVTEYDERSLTNPLAPLTDPRSTASAVYDAPSPASGRYSATSTTTRSRSSGSTSG